MEPRPYSREKFRDFDDIWTFNLQKIEGIQHSVEARLHELEHAQSDYGEVYEDIAEQLDLLSSIYSGYNTVEGNEYILRLKSVLESHGKRCVREGLDFNLIHYLLAKISDMRDRSVERFPLLSHAAYGPGTRRGAWTDDGRTLKKYKWITFARNRSWFIASFTNVLILKNGVYPIESFDPPDLLNVNINDIIYKVRDIFTKFPRLQAAPAYYLLIDDRQKNFAADGIGRRIYADVDIVTPGIRPFAKAERNSLSPGRVRMFGINHLLLY
jgi:hypothetical protein